MTEQSTQAGHGDCCRSQASDAASANGSADRFGRLSTPAAVGAAILSSACCWLPLLLLAVGLSAGGVAGFFETVRPFFLAAAVVFLGTGFYFAYFRKPACKPGDACAVPNPKLKRFNRAMLWIATVFVIAFMLFPYYSPAIVRAFANSSTAASIDSSGPTDAVATVTRTFHVDGMTCPSCAAALEVQLSKLARVNEASVSYADGIATIRSPAGQPSDEQVRAAIHQAGFRPTER